MSTNFWEIFGIISGLLFLIFLLIFLDRLRGVKNIQITDDARLFRILNRKKLIGVDIKKLTTSNYNDCAKKCIIEEECKGFTFDYRTNECSLKKEIIDKADDENINSGLRYSPI